MIVALMTNRNNPSVTIVIGKVKKIRIGFTYTFIKTSSNETSKAVEIPFTSTPGIRLAIKKTDMAVVTILIRNFILGILKFKIRLFITFTLTAGLIIIFLNKMTTLVVISPDERL